MEQFRESARSVPDSACMDGESENKKIKKREKRRMERNMIPPYG